jgi:hypothetical protein
MWVLSLAGNHLGRQTLVARTRPTYEQYLVEARPNDGDSTSAPNVAGEVLLAEIFAEVERTRRLVFRAGILLEKAQTWS